jgi:hypothetical protein
MVAPIHAHGGTMNTKTDHSFLASAAMLPAEEPEAVIDAWTLDEVDLTDLRLADSDAQGA